MQIRWTDTHCHLNAGEFDDNRMELIEQSRSVGVGRLVVPSVDPEDAVAIGRWIGKAEGLYFAVGFHPWFLGERKESDVAQALHDLLLRFKDHSRLVAIGEIGLDGALDISMDRQQACFQAQLEIARDQDLPVIIHARRAFGEVIDVLREAHFTGGGIVHAFSGSQQQGEALIDLGFKLGIGGALSQPNARRLRNVIKKLPEEALVLETDSPDMRPAWLAQGEPNTPLEIPAIAESLAYLLDISIEELSWLTETAVNDVLFGGHHDDE
jgi:TatD DNase family protein